MYGIIGFNVPLNVGVWDFRNAYVNYIQGAVLNVDWNFLFCSAHINKKVDITKCPLFKKYFL